MSETASLLPPIGVIHERLTRNQRERAILRTLLKLSVRAEQEQERKPLFRDQGGKRAKAVSL
jgi:hypothetical protein